MAIAPGEKKASARMARVIYVLPPRTVDPRVSHGARQLPAEAQFPRRHGAVPRADRDQGSGRERSEARRRALPALAGAERSRLHERHSDALGLADRAPTPPNGRRGARQNDRRRQDVALRPWRARASCTALRSTDLEAGDRFRFVLVDLEHGDELRDVQQLIELGRQVEELELAAAVGGGGVRTDQLADARRVDRRDAGQVEQDLGLARS